jgi:glutamate-1-semialdehyde 2,1-aminomutase
VLTEVTDQDYAELSSRVGSFAARLASAISYGGLSVNVPVVGPLVGLFLAASGDAHHAPNPVPVDYVTAHRWASNGVYPRFFPAMVRRGVALAPGAYEVMFPGLSHTDEVLNSVVEAAGESAAEVAKDVLESQN